MKNEYIYAVRNKESGELISKYKGNPYYSRKGAAEAKVYNDNYEVITYKLVEVEND